MSQNSSAAPTFLDDASDATVPRKQSAGLGAFNLEFAEAQYKLYLSNRNAVTPDWRSYFDELQAERGDVAPDDLESPFQTVSLFHPRGRWQADAGQEGTAPSRFGEAALSERIAQLIRNYRVRGHIAATVDPLGRERPHPAELDLNSYGFTEQDLDQPVHVESFANGIHKTLGELLEGLRATYCRSIGVQYMHIDSERVRSWLQGKMEATANHLRLKRREQYRILSRLSDAVVFEEFIQKKFVGAKSFSLEGAETLIPLLDMAISKAAEDGVELIVLGMAHRGRLNVLANIMGKSPRAIFREFEDRDPERFMGRGDVKYHLGFSNDYDTPDGRSVHLTLCFNPSHLEFVNPVALGRLRAKQDRLKHRKRKRSVAFLIHGDAAFAGEGVVQETLNLSELSGYQTGGTVHIIVNNQIGFTTSPSEGRSCTYASDVARMLQSPIFHVNGEDPEAVAQVVNLAMDFRETFHRDVIIDMYCFRRRGHNEGDEPAFTQPTMYQTIRNRDSVFQRYQEFLLQMGGIDPDVISALVEQYTQLLEDELQEARKDTFEHLEDIGGGSWTTFFGGPHEHADQVTTALPMVELQSMLRELSSWPEEFSPHPTIRRLMKQRGEMADGKRRIDWGTAEAAAFGAAVRDGHPLRFTGQDVRRGTFSHRHAVLYDHSNGKPFMPLRKLCEDHRQVQIYNSPLSEAGVLGFDYGYSLDCPDGLVIWEAQFGDFVNTAQVIIDQFITSAEDKWSRLSGLVMLLPHGFEGQGPEHSSARLERFLTLAAEDNIQVVVPSTAGQYFHLMRRQTLRRWKKPLVVMTPKSLLRSPSATCSLEDLATGTFQNVVPDTRSTAPEDTDRILLCAGKVYHELHEARKERRARRIAILRIEQLYPFPLDDLQAAMQNYAAGTPVVWVQEEPANMGAWPFMRYRFGDQILDRFPLTCVSRVESSSPATGSGHSHKVEQARLIDHALSIDKSAG